MIIGTGLDLVEIRRVAALLERHGPDRLRRVFGEAELAHCLGRADPAAGLAARFAAKEAFYKALGTGVGRAGGWTDVEVVSEPGGRPRLRLAGRAARSAERAGVARVHLSLTHTGALAAAQVVLEGHAAVGRGR